MTTYAELPRLPGAEPVKPDTINAPDGIEILSAWIGLDPNAISYGTMLIVFTYHDKLFKAHWAVRTPGQPGYMAHRMTELEELVLVKKPYPHWNARPAETGTKAFWMYTPTKSLDGDDLVIRQLMLALKDYGVQNGLCAKLRKAEKELQTSRPAK